MRWLLSLLFAATAACGDDAFCTRWAHAQAWDTETYTYGIRTVRGAMVVRGRTLRDDRVTSAIEVSRYGSLVSVTARSGDFSARLQFVEPLTDGTFSLEPSARLTVCADAGPCDASPVPVRGTVSTRPQPPSEPEDGFPRALAVAIEGATAEGDTLSLDILYFTAMRSPEECREDA